MSKYCILYDGLDILHSNLAIVAHNLEKPTWTILYSQSSKANIKFESSALRSGIPYLNSDLAGVSKLHRKSISSIEKLHMKAIQLASSLWSRNFGPFSPSRPIF